ncbi:bath-40 [Symbiodinium sp. CCMP2592]|nr:bath-40 [Symbiodinium sp. CCMP2592]
MQPCGLCVDDDDLVSLLNSWGHGKKRKAAATAATEQDELQPIIDSVAELKAQKPRKSRQHSVDILQTLWCLYEEDGSRGTFLGYWVTIIPGQLKGPFAHDDLGALRDYASNSTCLCLGKGWLIWMLPHFSVYLTGFSFCRLCRWLAAGEALHCAFLHRQVAARSLESLESTTTTTQPRAMATTAAYGDQDLSAASDVWGACFGKEGNFTVIVEESPADTSDDVEVEDKHTEFKVWSFLLTQWSPVFEKMIGSDNYTESQKAKVVIQDFSASAVEIFLRFLYSGSVGGSVTALVEVAAMADKYQVKKLHALCLRIVRKALKPEVACEIFDSANKFQFRSLRMGALDLIFTQPAEALKERPALRPELLEEILDSGLLCMSEDDLKKTLQSWGEKEGDCLQPIIDARIQCATVRTPGERTTSVLKTLWDRYVNAGKKGAFLGFWVVVILGPEQAEMCQEDARSVKSMASNNLGCIYRKGWVQWLLPHSSVHLQGFSFSTSYSEPISASTSLRIWCSEDSTTWHLAYESTEKKIASRTFLPCKRPPGLVKSFRLEVLEGEISIALFNIHGSKRKLSDVLTACFGKDGNFTVIVLEPSGETSDDAQAKRTEFKVWSSLLAQWSPVFEKMVGSANYAESQKAEVIIRDFSADAVELFLRFFYSGSVAGSIPVLVEVAAMADKYQVEALQCSCLHLVRRAMKPDAACVVLASADRFHMADLRAEALDLIFTQPAEALKERPTLRPELLEEILDSVLLCMSEDDLKKTLQSWGEKEGDCLQPIIEAKIQRATVRTPGVHTTNVLRTLWDRYVNAGKKGAFLGYWVVVILGPEQAQMCREDAAYLKLLANGQYALNCRKGSVQWLLPYCLVHLQGFSLVQKISGSTSFRISVKSDEGGATWHLAYESHKKEIKEGTFLPCKRPPSLVKCFKLEVLEGECYLPFNIQGSDDAVEANVRRYGAKQKRDDVLAACFGVDGNFTVIVEERSGETSDDAGAKRTEFKVWASLLANWSSVFERMIGSRSYAESQKAEVVIHDFSASAVEIFLRFLYSGSVKGSPTATDLMEVAGIADKYQVEALHTVCLHDIRRALTFEPALACEVFASADRFHMADLRAEALDLIFTKAAKALRERPTLRPELLEEILDSGLLCMSEDDVIKTLQSWGEKEGDCLQPIIEARIQLATVRTSGEHTTDVLKSLWDHYVNAGKRGAFLGYWVVVMLGPGLSDVCGEDAGYVTAMARNDAPRPVTLRAGWVQWIFPHSWIRLQGFSGFSVCQGRAAKTSFRICTSADGATWHLAYESQKKEIWESTLLACKRPPSMVRYFKLEVLEGEISQRRFNIHGILQTSDPSGEGGQWRLLLTGTIAGHDHTAASAALTACFGTEGNFTVTVEEHSGDTSDDVEVCTEFRVWSSLLAHWSAVFERMVGSEIYAESQKAEVIIRDFSAIAVELFLRFLYTGSVHGSASALLEVAALADKYQVQVLHALCMRLVREALKPELACEVFAAAYRFHMDDLRSDALDLIFTRPAEALKERPAALRPELLEEILSSGLLCFAEDALQRTLHGWGNKDDSLQPIVEARIQLATAMIGGEDLSVASGAWKACFGKDGNFTVIVEEPSFAASDDVNEKVETETKRTEFQVWSSILSHYSPVFEKMVGCGNYAEAQKSEVVIQDFSARAVELFLRFLYTGSVRSCASALLEVAAMADKYEVRALHALCIGLVRNALQPCTACEVFENANRFHMDDLRLEALELILTKPEDALKTRPALRPELLEEILGSGLLCMSGDALKKILQSWGDKDDPLQPIIKAWIPSTPLRAVSLRGEHTTNVLQSLWKSYCDAGNKGTFVGYWVNVLLGPGQSQTCTHDNLSSMASMNSKFTFQRGWVQWYLPYCSVHLQGFSLAGGHYTTICSGSTSFRIYVKSDEDGATWHLAYESHRKVVGDGTFLPCKRPPGLVKHFKLEVLEGELSNARLEIRGILQTSV